LGGATLVALALSVKPQVVFVLPVVAFVLLRRDWRRPLRLATLGATSVAVWFASGVPFALGPGALVHLYRTSAATAPYTSAWAFNLWGANSFFKDDLRGADVITVLGVEPLFRWLYGTACDATQKKVLSVVTSIVCLAIAWLGWRTLERAPATTRTSGR